MRLELSQHFCENWLKRVGNWPTAAAVHQYIAESVKIQHCRELLETDGSPFRMLAVYWHPRLNVIMTVDHIRGKAVSVLSEVNCRRSRLEVQGSKQRG